MNESYLKFDRAYTPGMQEFIEAISLLHYLKEGELIKPSKIEEIIDLDNVISYFLSFKI